MLLSISSSLYEALLGPNISQPEYRQQLFPSVGLITFIMAVVICALFYVALGRWRAVWYTRAHWFITIFITFLIAALFAYSQAKSAIGTADNYLYLFAIINGIYAAIYFILFSFLFKNFSTFSKRVPI